MADPGRPGLGFFLWLPSSLTSETLMPGCRTWPRAGRGPRCRLRWRRDPLTGAQRPDPDRSQAAAGDPAGPDRADGEASVLPVRRANTWKRPRSRFPPSSPPRAVSAWAGPSWCPTSWRTPPTARSASTIPGGTSSTSTSSHQASSATPWRPCCATPGRPPIRSHGGLELHQRQLPAAVGCVAGASPPAIRPRRLRSDRSAPLVERSGAWPDGHSSYWTALVEQEQPTDPGGSAAPGGWPG